jgi:hypothetical protein
MAPNQTVPNLVNKHADKHSADKKRCQYRIRKAVLIQDRSKYEEKKQEKCNVYPKIDSKNSADADRPSHKIITSIAL